MSNCVSLYAGEPNSMRTPCGTHLSIPAVQGLLPVAVVNDDVAARNAGFLETVEDGVEDGRVGAESRPADRAHLDADDVALFEERPPRLGPARRAGEGGHPLLHHLADRLGLIRAVDDGPWMFHADHESRETVRACRVWKWRPCYASGRGRRLPAIAAYLKRSRRGIFTWVLYSRREVSYTGNLNSFGSRLHNSRRES